MCIYIYIKREREREGHPPRNFDRLALAVPVQVGRHPHFARK